MPNYVRWREKGATFFFTVVTHNRRPILTEPHSRRLLRDSFLRIRLALPFEMSCCVLLADHLHCLWTLPPGDDNFPERWRLIKTEYTQGWLSSGGGDACVTPHHHLEGRRGVWQPRYWEHRIRDEQDYYRHRDYIHLNPVKHGCADRPADWPWSSIHRHIRLGWLDPLWPGSGPVDLPDINE